MANRKSYERALKEINTKKMDVSIRSIYYSGGEVSVLYIKQLTDKAALTNNIIKPLILNAQKTMDAGQTLNIIYADDCRIESDENKTEGFLLNGMTVILFSNDTKYIVADIKKVEHRSIPTPEINYVLRGPKDCFIENLDSNISLIRYRIKNQKLKVDFLESGERTRTRIAVIYLEDIANEKSVNEIKKRISAIKTDGFIESGELQAFLLNKKTNLFPQMGIVERSDMACGALLEGKVITLVDGSALGLIAPKVLGEFLWTCDDFYDNKYVGFFLRILRVLALFVSTSVSALYVAIASFHSDVLPGDYIIALAQMRSKVPFNALVEVLLIEIISELLHDALIRIPSKMASGIGIVGAIIIGQAAISAGIFSPVLLIVVSLSLICSFIPSDNTFVNAFRMLKFILILASGTFGLYGYSLVVILIIVSLVSINTFGAPYMAPFSPFIWKDFIKSFFYSKSMAPRRPYYLRTRDKYRSKNGR